MITIDEGDKILEIILDTTPSVNPIEWTCNYIASPNTPPTDLSISKTLIPKQTSGIIPDTQPYQLCVVSDNTFSNQVNLITVYNADTSVCSLTIRVNYTPTLAPSQYFIITKIKLNPGYTFNYSEDGIFVTNEYGATAIASSPGTVTSVSISPNQGVSGTVTTPSTTPNITISIGNLTNVLSFNGLVITPNTGTVTTGTWNASVVGISYGGTGAITANTALNNLLPSQATNTGKYLQTDGVNTSWVSATSNPFADNTALIKNNTDNTKLAILSAANITTGTTRTYTLQDSNDTFVMRATTDTLTNKRFTNRTGTTTSSATPTINTDNYDRYTITALVANITSFTTNLTGTPVDGDVLEIRINDNGTARTIAWGASFTSTTNATLPTTTVISTTIRILLEWNSTTTVWECIAVN